MVFKNILYMSLFYLTTISMRYWLISAIGYNIEVKSRLMVLLHKHSPLKYEKSHHLKSRSIFAN
jgi:hypothetical protein